jgi:hypothetical protein
VTFVTRPVPKDRDSGSDAVTNVTPSKVVSVIGGCYSEAMNTNDTPETAFAILPGLRVAEVYFQGYRYGMAHRAFYVPANWNRDLRFTFEGPQVFATREAAEARAAQVAETRKGEHPAARDYRLGLRD